MLMLEEALARVRTTLDVETLQLTITQDNHQLIVADLDDEAARARVEEFFWQLVPAVAQRADAGALARRAFHGQAGQRHLADQSGDGAQPRSSNGASRSIRCAFAPISTSTAPGPGKSSTGSAATSGSATGCFGSTGATAAAARPTSIRRPAAATSICRARCARRSATRNLGVYLVAREGGDVAVGDHVAAPRSRRDVAQRGRSSGAALRAASSSCAAAAISSTSRRRDLPDQSIAPGTPFAAIPSNWRCPDCGTEKTTFRPHVEPDHQQSSGTRQIL